MDQLLTIRFGKGFYSVAEKSFLEGMRDYQKYIKTPLFGLNQYSETSFKGLWWRKGFEYSKRGSENAAESEKKAV